MMNTKISGLPMVRSWLLAYRYGHCWAWALAQHAGVDLEYHPTGGHGMLESNPEFKALVERGFTLDELASISKLYDDPDIPGIPHPYVDEDGDVAHTSSSGRIEWYVRGGLVEIYINRPYGGVCLQAIIHPDGEVSVAGGDPQTPAFHRHYIALRDTIEAIVPCWRISPELYDELISQEEFRDPESI